MQIKGATPSTGKCRTCCNTKTLEQRAGVRQRHELPAPDWSMMLTSFFPAVLNAWTCSGSPAKYLIVSSLCASSKVLRPATSVSIFLSVWVRALSCWACFESKEVENVRVCGCWSVPWCSDPELILSTAQSRIESWSWL